MIRDKKQTHHFPFLGFINVGVAFTYLWLLVIHGLTGLYLTRVSTQAASTERISKSKTPISNALGERGEKVRPGGEG